MFSSVHPPQAPHPDLTPAAAKPAAPKKDAKGKGLPGADGPELAEGAKLVPEALFAPTHLIEVRLPKTTSMFPAHSCVLINLKHDYWLELASWILVHVSSCTGYGFRPSVLVQLQASSYRRWSIHITSSAPHSPGPVG